MQALFDIGEKVAARVIEHHGAVVARALALLESKVVVAEAMACSYAAGLHVYVDSKITRHHITRRLDEANPGGAVWLDLNARWHDLGDRIERIHGRMYDDVCGECSPCNSRRHPWPLKTHFTNGWKPGMMNVAKPPLGNITLKQAAMLDFETRSSHPLEGGGPGQVLVYRDGRKVWLPPMPGDSWEPNAMSRHDPGTAFRNCHGMIFGTGGTAGIRPWMFGLREYAKTVIIVSNERHAVVEDIYRLGFENVNPNDRRIIIVTDLEHVERTRGLSHDTPWFDDGHRVSRVHGERIIAEMRARFEAPQETLRDLILHLDHDVICPRSSAPWDSKRYMK